MANTYFQFKQFRIEQNQVGMKVTTDGCFFGASISPKESGRILDIGTGTGLLALMLAQKSGASIDAIEINKDAYQQAKVNFEASDWKNRLRIFHTSLQEFQPSDLYDQIVCNPPFFVNSNQGTSANKNQALHATTLSMKDLAEHAARLMKEDAEVWIMYPKTEMEQFVHWAAQCGLYPATLITLRNSSTGPVFRQIIAFTKDGRNLTRQADVYIKESDGNYSEAFVKRLKDYYLHL